jgi:hypothetical protein
LKPIQREAEKLAKLPTSPATGGQKVASLPTSLLLCGCHGGKFANIRRAHIEDCPKRNGSESAGRKCAKNFNFARVFLACFWPHWRFGGAANQLAVGFLDQ